MDIHVEIEKIPFVKKIGIKKAGEGGLTLNFDKANHNHLQTIHAGALFTLAESASAGALLEFFPEFAGKVAPVVRDAQIKFRKPALHSVTAIASILDESVSEFKKQFQKRNRSLITVEVAVIDVDQNVVCNAAFNWFVLGIEQ